MKGSAFAREVQRQVSAELNRTARVRAQMAMDAACMAANETLGMGKGRAEEFCRAFCHCYDDMCRLIVTDSKDDKKIEYAKAKIDGRIKDIVGEELFEPFDVRYGGGR